MKFSTIEKFWDRVHKTETCWLWTWRVNADGYGLIHVRNANGRGDLNRAHRLSWFLNFGDFDRSLDVLHHCDNPPCVNPAHLFLGTHTDNMRDQIAKGRFPARAGESNGRSKITVIDSETIRRLCFDGVTQKEVGKMFGLSKGNISKIVSGAYWKSAARH